MVVASVVVPVVVVTCVVIPSASVVLLLVIGEFAVCKQNVFVSKGCKQLFFLMCKLNSV